MYVAVSLLSSRRRVDVFRAVLRVALACFLAFAFVEMFTNFHLPTCWLYSDDPYVVVQLQEVERSYENLALGDGDGHLLQPQQLSACSLRPLPCFRCLRVTKALL